MAAAKEIGERDIADKCLGDLGIVARKADQWERAAELYERALQATRASGHLRQEGIVLSNLAALELDRCHLREARELLNEARTIHRAVGEARSEAIALANLSSMELTVGRPTEALLRADEMMAILATVEHPVLARSLARVRGDALRYLGRREEAAEIWNATLEGARLVTNPVTEAEALCALAALKSEGGAPAEGRPLAAEAAAIARATGIPRALASALLESGDIELADGAFDEAEAFFAEALGILEPIDHTIDLARSRIGVARAAVGLGRTEEARETEALAREAIATVGAGPESPVGRALAALHRELGSGALPLRVDEDVTWVGPPGGERIAMARKAILRRVLRCLVRARGDRPGEHVDLDTLPTAAWPNDRSDRDAMANRLYVAIHALRKLGLDAVLLSRGDGYLLDPHVPLKVNSPRS
ncbi:MAG: hypothetical protein GY898_32580 [Proteobacteria bacterium]|nr:hypothetical protein [Pseudomonadota bacterium]